MRIAVINETSSADRNPDIITSLDGRGHDVINLGMKKGGVDPQLSYMHTGFLAGLVLKLDLVDFVVGGCGTGQGFLNSAMQYPGVFCGHILNSLDAWLFTLINGGNAISLALNQGYGWAGDVNLGFIFDRIFSEESGAGYPEHRKKPQAEARELLKDVSSVTHKPFHEIINDLPDSVVVPALSYPGAMDFIKTASMDKHMEAAIMSRVN